MLFIQIFDAYELRMKIPEVTTLQVSLILLTVNEIDVELVDLFSCHFVT